MKIKQDYYSNSDITVYWDQTKCVHAGVCYSSLRRVFDPLHRPWIRMGGASTDEIIETVGKCPTGALSFKWNVEHQKEFAH